jgi:hypothetical protein
LDSKVFEETGDPPNANAIVGWILQVIAIPNVNPYQIAKSVGFVRQEAQRRAEDLKKKPAVSVQEAKEVKLEQLPEDAQMKVKASQKTVGWVKEESPAAPASQPQSPAQAPVSSQTNESVSSDAGEAPKKKRALAAIPTAGSSSEATASYAPSSAKSQEIKGEQTESSTYVVKVPKGTKKIIIEFD